MVLRDYPVIPYIYLPIRTAKTLVSNIRNIRYPQDLISVRPAKYLPTALTIFILFFFFFFSLAYFYQIGLKEELLRITDGRASYCVYATNSLEVDLALECRLAFFLELLQYWNVIHVTQLRDYEARLANLTLEQPLTFIIQSTTNFNTAYVPLQVIFVHVNKASIPTLISRRTDQEILKSQSLRTVLETVPIARPCLFQLKEKATLPSKLETTYQLTADA